MAINFNLSDLSSAQKRAGTGRRYNTPYTYSLLSATPQARQGAIDEADAAYKQSVLNQEKDQFNTQLEQDKTQYNTSLAQNAAQYNTSLAQTARQFNENQAMQRAIAEEQAAQAETASYVLGGQTALTLAALTKDAWLPAAKEALGFAAPKVVAAAAPAVTASAAPTAAGAAEAAVPLTGAGTGTALEATTMGGIGKSSAAAGAGVGGSIGSGIGKAYGALSGSTTASATAGSIGAGIGSGVGYAAPYYAAYKMGSAIMDQIENNNPQLREGAYPLIIPADEPLAVEQHVGQTLANMGVGNTETNKVIANAINPIGDVMTNVGKSTDDTLSAIANVVSGGTFGVIDAVFCFAAGTPITLANGDIIPIERIDLFDECDEGGMVNGKGVTLANDLYDYAGVQVTGSHAVYEEGEWKRVKDSNMAIHLPTTEYVKVYIVNNDNHILMVNGIRFADYGEVTNSEEMTAQERLVYLNEHCRI